MADDPMPHPIRPPADDDDRLNWLRLIRSRRVGPATFYRLMREQGSAAAALAALPGIAGAAGVADYRFDVAAGLDALRADADAPGVQDVLKALERANG